MGEASRRLPPSWSEGPREDHAARRRRERGVGRVVVAPEEQVGADASGHERGAEGDVRPQHLATDRVLGRLGRGLRAFALGHDAQHPADREGRGTGAGGNPPPLLAREERGLLGLGGEGGIGRSVGLVDPLGGLFPPTDDSSCCDYLAGNHHLDALHRAVGRNRSLGINGFAIHLDLCVRGNFPQQQNAGRGSWGRSGRARVGD